MPMMPAGFHAFFPLFLYGEGGIWVGRAFRVGPDLSNESESELATISEPIGPAEAESAWQEANHDCYWSYSSWRCTSEASKQDLSKCKWKGMPLDKSWSEGCRIGDDWQLKTNPSKWLRIRIGQLEGKLAKYEDRCGGSAGMYNPKCWRRSRHISRAVAFLTKAQNPAYELSEEDQDMTKGVIEKATETLTAGSPHSARIAKLLRLARAKVERDKGLGSVGVLRRVAKVMGSLLMSDEEQQREAVEWIDGLTEAGGVGVNSSDPWTFSVDELVEDAGMQVPYNENLTLSPEELNTSMRQIGHGLSNMTPKLEEQQRKMESLLDNLETGADGSGCTTTGKDGVGAGHPCVFPFLYEGRSYKSCTSVDRPMPWCATETNSSGQLVAGQWGYCAASCPDEVNGSAPVNGSALLELAAKRSKGPTAWLVGSTSAIATALIYLKTTIIETLVANKIAEELNSVVSWPSWLGFAEDYVSASIVDFAALVAGPLIYAGLISYAVMVAWSCAILSGILPWIWGKCFLKGLALPFMLVGNVVECFGALIEGALRGGWPRYFRCQPLPIFSGFWDPRFPRFEEPKVKGRLSADSLVKYIKQKLYHDGVAESELKATALQLLGMAAGQISEKGVSLLSTP